MKKLFFFAAIILICTGLQAQMKFRSGMFFHHSTGLCIWGPNGSSTSVPQQMTIYNTSHGYTGLNAVTMSELWFPVNVDNEWYLWHEMFEQNTPENISSYFSGNKIIMVKSCFPSSALEGVGEPCDTLTPDYKTIYNYKWHWRHIIRVMRVHPQNFFVIWTNAPLVQGETSPEAAGWSKQFCKWAKDTLAAGLDPVIGSFPFNVYVFDFFSKLTNSNGYLQPQYASSSSDSHPNAAATALVAPMLVNETFDHSIAYESLFGIRKIDGSVPGNFGLMQNYPNPFNSSTIFNFSFPVKSMVTLKIFNIQGREVASLLNGTFQPGNYQYRYDAPPDLPGGVYFYKMTAGNFSGVKKMVLVK
ncbi:MAG: T9SS type A sorting domain-containing protein [Bacteroidetes bacterium]|nr:T9SS type A sorting domain-containing protein [Bacteroidota bacterium]